LEKFHDPFGARMPKKIPKYRLWLWVMTNLVTAAGEQHAQSDVHLSLDME